VIESAVLAYVAKHQQVGSRDTEAGGQLFGRVLGNTVTVEIATGPRLTDIRTRYSYQPDRRAEQDEIDRYHRKGLLFWGDWHTHPEQLPTPSVQDQQSIRETFKRSTHHLNGFLLVIAGTHQLPYGLYVAIHNEREILRLLPQTP
jgi:integrative and conjugative element protein (TIGR02256 family)